MKGGIGEHPHRWGIRLVIVGESPGGKKRQVLRMSRKNWD